MNDDTPIAVGRPILTLPGIHSSGPDHWQSVWEREHVNVRRVEQRDWSTPQCSDWMTNIEKAVGEQDRLPILVAHSLGCLAAARWMGQTALSVHGLVLVAIPDPASSRFPTGAHGFDIPPGPIRHDRLVIISSEDDPYASPAFSRRCATLWHATLLSAGHAGHINAQTPVGNWQGAWDLVMSWQ